MRGNFCCDFGDDGITAHWSDKLLVTGNFVWGGTGSFTGANSGIEIDDGMRGSVVCDNNVWDLLCYSDPLVAGAASTGILCKGHGASTHPPGSPSAEATQVLGNRVSHCVEGIAAHNNATIATQAHTLIEANVVEYMTSCGIRSTGGFDLAIIGNKIHYTCRELQNSGPVRCTGSTDMLTVSGNIIRQGGQAGYAINIIGALVGQAVVNGNNIKDVYQGIRVDNPNMSVVGNTVIGGAPARGTPSQGLVTTASVASSVIVGNILKGFTTNIDTSVIGAANQVANNVVV